jgi:NTE family protein
MATQAPLAYGLTIACALAMSVCSAAAWAQEENDVTSAQTGSVEPPAADTTNLRADFDTCLVLSGGGARGMAHLGVIKVLERERIPIDCIVGTSMGAVVGSLYASGMRADEIETQMRALDWGSMFVDRIDRRVYTLRRKTEDRSFLAKGGFGVRDGKLGVPPSLFEGQRLALALRAALMPSAGMERFDALPIPYRAIGTDLETGDAVVMDAGDLVNAVRASMAVPGVFSPVSYGERSLIDGGIAMNLPVEAAQQWGAKRIIAVDISATLKTRDQLLDPFSITDQMVTALMVKETKRQRERLRAGDVLIVPALGDLSSADFDAGLEQGVPLGVAAAEAALPQLRGLSVSEAQYAQWREQRVAKLRPLGKVSEVKLVNTSGVDDDAIRSQLHTQPGDVVEPTKIEEDLSRLYGLGQFSRAYYTLDRDENDDAILTYVTRNRRWEQDGTLKLGLFMQDDFQGGGEYQLGARYVKRELNRFGGDLVLEARIGDRNRAFAEWNQPLRLDRRTFVRSSLEWRGRNQTLLDDAGLAADYRYAAWEARASIGFDLDRKGEITLTPFVRRNHFDLRRDSQNIFAPNIPSTAKSHGVELSLVFDTQDDAEFPSRGWYLDARHARYLPAMGSDREGFVSKANANIAFEALRGRWLLGIEAQDRRGDSHEDVATLGGPLRLSGYGVDALRNDGALLTSLRYNYPLAQVLDYPLFFGGSLEAGQLWRRGEDPAWDRFIAGGSIYGALDTPLGPIYVGVGLAEGGEETLFFRLGQPE